MYFSSIVKLERIIASGDEKVQPIKAKTLPRAEAGGTSTRSRNDTARLLLLQLIKEKAPRPFGGGASRRDPDPA
jgi:hypothetical protein